MAADLTLNPRPSKPPLTCQVVAKAEVRERVAAGAAGAGPRERHEDQLLMGFGVWGGEGLGGLGGLQVLEGLEGDTAP